MGKTPPVATENRAAVKAFLGRGMDATQRTGRAPLALVAENGLEVVVAAGAWISTSRPQATNASNKKILGIE